MNWIKKLRRRFRKEKKEPVKRSEPSKFESSYSRELTKMAEGEPPEILPFEGLLTGTFAPDLSCECDDCISRTDALNINLDKIRYINDGILYVSYMDVLREIRGLSSVTPIRKKDKWIPVDEQLPEKSGDYLMTWTAITGTYANNVFMELCEYEELNEYDYEHNRFKGIWHMEDCIDDCTGVYVTAWMPLPEPYKGVEE